MEFVKSEVTVTAYGETVKLRLPTYKEVIKFRSDDDACEGDEIKKTDLLFSLLASLGLPESIGNQLELSHMSQLIDELLKKR